MPHSLPRLEPPALLARFRVLEMLPTKSSFGAMLLRAEALAWAIAFCSIIVPAVGSEPGAELVSSIRSIQAEPALIYLRGANRQQQLLITGKSEAGRLLDLTRVCELSVSETSVARISGTRVVGLGDGTAELRVQLRDHRLTVPVRVAGFDRYPPVHFENDVMPVLSKTGCNSGGCHGKATGQNGFKLSVFGFDPSADYDSLVKEGRGRRVFPAVPEKSLLLLKPVALVPHGGGKRMQVASRDHQVLFEWIRQGSTLR